MGFVAPLLLGLLVLLSLRQSRRPLAGRTWMLLRSLVPSWRFFEEVEPCPELLFCVLEGDRHGPWRAALIPPARRGLWLNAAGNLHLAQQSLVEQLWSELDSASPAAAVQLTSYRLVQRLVAERVRAERGASVARFRFALATTQAGDLEFESAEHST